MNPEVFTIDLYVSDSTGMNPEVFTIDWYVSNWTGDEPWGCYINLYVNAIPKKWFLRLLPFICMSQWFQSLWTLGLLPWSACHSDCTGMNPEVVTLICMSVIPQQWTLKLLHRSVCQWFHRNKPWGCYIGLYVSDSTGMNTEAVKLICMSVIPQEWTLRFLQKICMSVITTWMNLEVFTIAWNVSDSAGMNCEFVTLICMSVIPQKWFLRLLPGKCMSVIS